MDLLTYMTLPQAHSFSPPITLLTAEVELVEDGRLAAEVVLLAEVELGPWGDVVSLAVGGQMNARAEEGCIL